MKEKISSLALAFFVIILATTLVISRAAPGKAEPVIVMINGFFLALAQSIRALLGTEVKETPHKRPTKSSAEMI